MKKTMWMHTSSTEQKTTPNNKEIALVYSLPWIVVSMLFSFAFFCGDDAAGAKWHAASPEAASVPSTHHLRPCLLAMDRRHLRAESATSKYGTESPLLISD
uniref:Uncharacterized protein n=1 Tax=Cyclophora tenuis TaxID=216820 RepID=A0A7S1D8G9_CYCTE